MNYIISGIIALLIIGSGWYMLAVRPAQIKSAAEQNNSTTQTTEDYSQDAGTLESSAQVTEATTQPAPTSTEGAPTSTQTTTNTNNMTIVTLATNKGDITLELDTKNTPKTVENFVTLAQKGFYNGVKFHRVIKGFMIQGGDPLTKDDSQMAAWGTGGPGYKFADEINPATNHNLAGTIAMANAGPNTNGSQFFINVNNNAFLDGKHTVFGKVTAGMDVVTAIENVATVPGDRPVDAVIITKATVTTK
jgi:cyclophilin family peptidyl-prolyl cis-trans isomerase